MSILHLHLTPQEWLFAALAALCIGLAKTGLSGFGILGVALFSLFLPTRQASGAIIPLLICADVVAVLSFRHHAVWRHILRMFVPAAGGIVLGYFALGLPLLRSNDHVRILIGAIITSMILFTYYRRWQANRATQKRQSGEMTEGGAEKHNDEDRPHSLFAAVAIGVVAGFLTMVANASGPLMALYLLAIGLPKMEFLGTGAYLYLTLNCFKVPFSAKLGFINVPSLELDALVAPVAIAGALWGRWMIGFVNQKLFENLALFFALLSGLNLLIIPLLKHH